MERGPLQSARDIVPQPAAVGAPHRDESRADIDAAGRCIGATQPGTGAVPPVQAPRPAKRGADAPYGPALHDIGVP